MKKFLIADDDADDVELFQEALHNIDPTIRCYIATNGLQVLDKLDSKEFDQPDIIFLDINMPEMDGWQCLTRLKKAAAYQHIPVIIYSTSDKKREAEIALDLGALCFYTKPSDFRQLQNILALIASSSKETVREAMRNYEGLKSHNMFVCS